MNLSHAPEQFGKLFLSVKITYFSMLHQFQNHFCLVSQIQLLLVPLMYASTHYCVSLTKAKVCMFQILASEKNLKRL